jgi:uncharacterized RDD family membrane protein YckC
MSQVPVPPEGFAPPPPGLGGPTSGVPAERATFWQRLGAALLDGILIGVVAGLLNAIFGNEPGEVSPAATGLQLVLGIAYYVFFHGSPSGQTVGKKVLNIRLLSSNDGNPPGYGAAALRYVGSIVSAIPCLLGYLWMLWDNNKQTWHDKIASTVVVPESAAPVTKWPG